MAAESIRVDVRERRVFAEAEKRRIVTEYRAAIAGGTGGGEVPRREGIYQSLVWNWGNQIDDGTLGQPRPGPGARKPVGTGSDQD